MTARFYYNIKRHHGAYGLAVSVYKTKEDRMRDYEECSFKRRLAYLTTYKHQTEDGCDVDAQVAELKARILKRFPGCTFENA